MLEQDVMNLTRLRAETLGWRLWRNNVGAGVLQTGSFLRWGLANDSERVNRALKSSDLVGIRPITITQAMVGQTIGQFVSLEVKSPTWRQPRNDHERAQDAWLDLVNASGGLGLFITSPEDIS